MLTVLAASAMALQPVAAAPGAPIDADLRCMGSYLVAAGNMDEDAKASADDKAGVQSIVMYFFGKVYARMPSLDVKGELEKLLTPQYLTSGLTADLERCSAEAVARGNYLSSIGDGAQKPPAGAAHSSH